ncbi:hypothetical protein [Chitinophaga sancti]|uniref:Uncharacterized protein n=1 Tax=Chitinophaga sancti TaxID=1004 RepID=A0A1K1SFZ9_9BACT|nr:hypothetical protein [Chitinophaga sancti]WQD59800.1 hypothetical protein U0033_18080 [Chitinophaga sancti]WQG88069.1 hypothetical protein SR876_24385 [Chitinophaga sancti]SFW82999.1 hypothetical protein SAMN05661012_05322 [Chitinophaga sancti]
MLKVALPVLYSILMVFGHRALASEPCQVRISVSPDTLPTDLRNRALLNQPALKQAVILAVNQRAGPNSSSESMRVPDSIPFNKLGLGGMNTSAKSTFTQYLESGRSAAGMARMKTMFNEMKDSTKAASYI